MEAMAWREEGPQYLYQDDDQGHTTYPRTPYLLEQPGNHFDRQVVMFEVDSQLLLRMASLLISAQRLLMAVGLLVLQEMNHVD